MNNRTELKLNLTKMDSIVKLQCLNTECVNNLAMGFHDGAFECNNKYITLDVNGKCENFAERRSTNKVNK